MEIDTTILTDQTKFRLNEISKIENYFNWEVNQRKLCSKKLSKYVTAFDYIDKILTVLSATAEVVCIASHATIVGAPVGMTSAGFTIVFSLATGIIKALLNTTRNKNKKHDKILMLAQSKLNSTETLVFQPLIDKKTSHGEFITILNEKDECKKMKENVRNLNEKQKNMRLNSVNSRTYKANCVRNMRRFVGICMSFWVKTLK